LNHPKKPFWPFRKNHPSKSQPPVIISNAKFDQDDEEQELGLSTQECQEE